jgi:hypothetical protein
LIHPDKKIIFSRINQQNQIIPFSEFITQKPVSFPAQPPGIIPFHGVPEFPGKSKGNPVVLKPVPACKKLRSGTGNAPAPVKNFPYFIPSL